MLKKLIVCTALLLAANSSFAVTLKIATLVPNGTTWMKEFKVAARDVKEKTEGRVKLKFFPGGVMGSDQSVLRKMRVGQLHGAAMPAAALAGFYNGAQIYGLPFLFKDYAEVRHVRPLLDADVEAGLAANGIVLLGISEGGFAYLMSNRPLHSSEDLQQQKVWIPEGDVISQSIFASAGVTPVSLPVSDVYTGLQTGLIDTVGINPTGAIALQWHTKVKSVTDEPLLFLMGTMVVSQRAFKKVNAADQQVVKAAVSAAFARLDKVNRSDDDKARKALEDSGVEFVALSDADRLQWQALAEQSLEDLASKAVYPVELLQQVQDSLAAYRKAQAAGQ